MLTGCSDDYLTVASEGDVTTTTLFATTRMLDGAVNGLSLIMSST